MAYTGKTNWQNNEIVEASDMNRIEQGISDIDVGLGNVQAEVTTHKAEIASSTQLGHVKVGQNLTIDSNGTLHAQASGGKKVARFVIGTSTAGWTEKDCDYLCDGTNDQVEIQQALDALPEDGGEVRLLDGTYNITASINISKDNVSIRGNGNATVIKRMWDSSFTEGVITLTSVEGCRVENLQIDGNKATYTASYNSGIYLNSSTNNMVTGNTCNNNENNSIRLYLSSNNTITGNTCYNNNYGIYLSSSSNNTIAGNTCNNNNSDGIYSRLSSNNMVTSNACNNNTNGIYLYSSGNNNITGNTCYNNNNNGIYLSSSSNNNAITGNTCNNNNYGIHPYSSSNNTITGNTCNNNNYGIHLYSSSNNNITGNTCIRGTGTSEDYSTNQYTIYLSGVDNNYNLISINNCMGKAVVISGGTGNSDWINKFDET